VVTGAPAPQPHEQSPLSLAAAHPGAPYPGVAYPGVSEPRPPRGGTAGTAIALSFFGGFYELVSAGVKLGSAGPGGIPLAQAILLGPAALALLAGAMMLAKHVGAGRWVIVAGCALSFAAGIAGLVGVLSSSTLDAGVPHELASTLSTAVVVLQLIPQLPALATLILAALPLTGRWAAWHRAHPEPEL
jgi:hypothetical protein